MSTEWLKTYRNDCQSVDRHSDTRYTSGGADRHNLSKNYSKKCIKISIFFQNKLFIHKLFTTHDWSAVYVFFPLKHWIPVHTYLSLIARELHSYSVHSVIYFHLYIVFQLNHTIGKTSKAERNTPFVASVS